MNANAAFETKPALAPVPTLIRFFSFVSSGDRLAMGLLRVGLVVVLVWIGGLKFVDYEADSIVPFVANSPILRFVYRFPAPEYKPYANREGDLIPKNHVWHEANRTYPGSYGLGVIILSIGLLIACYPVSPRLSALGSLLLICMALTTLSFLVTTPEAWVYTPSTGINGFPFLAGAGRLVVKDLIMLGAAFVTLIDSAKHYLLSHRETDAH
jgi:reactive chlorine resistance protein C